MINFKGLMKMTEPRVMIRGLEVESELEAKIKSRLDLHLGPKLDTS
jgi:hypothetical protein